MGAALAINGSPKAEKGRTAILLASFLDGMRASGYTAEVFHAGRLDIKPCSCGQLYCWTKEPGVCCIRDGMDAIYRQLSVADVLVLATPVYIPMPGEMQNVLNRLCPVLDPKLELRDGRTRGRLREGIAVRKLALVSTGGWWERGNFESLIHICEEFAATASIEFAGGVVRPHAHFMYRGGDLTEDGERVLAAAERAGAELAEFGSIRPETLEAVSRPLISREDYWAAWGA
jgi:multimeric flavodoxin WrbA